jgi:ketosteroid isomerase-like protein
VVGKAAIQLQLKQAFANHPKLKVLKYVPDIKDVQIAGDVAYEWGFFLATSQAGDAQPVSFRARYMRVLRKQPDGLWKFARVMRATDK